MGSSFILSLALSVLCGFVFTPHMMPEAGVANSSTTSPVGLWKTVDDATGKVKSEVVIWEDHSKLYGRIEKLLDANNPDPNPRCKDCSGAQKGQPVIGLQILWDLHKDGNVWSGGMILDPENGRTYRCLLALVDGGKKLKVRGFIGLALLGRTQYWLRE